MTTAAKDVHSSSSPAAIVRVSFRHGDRQTEIMLSDRMSEDDLNEVMYSAFELDRNVVGVQSKDEGTIFPFSFLCRAPVFFQQYSKTNPLTLILKDYVTGGERQARVRNAIMDVVRSGLLEKIHVDDIADTLKYCAHRHVFSAETFKSLVGEIVYLATRQNTLVPVAESGKDGDDEDEKDEDERRGRRRRSRRSQREEGEDEDVRLMMGLFEALDSDRTGTVDTDEMLCALTMMCSGDRDRKIEVGFHFYTNERCELGEASLTAYLLAMFSVMHATDEEKFVGRGTTVSELAVASAKQCFAFAAASNGDVKGDVPRVIPFETFKSWYKSTDVDRGGVSAEDEGEEGGDNDDDDDDDDDVHHSSSLSPFAAAAKELKRRRHNAISGKNDDDDDARNIVAKPVAGLRAAAGLCTTSPDALLERFARATDEEGLIHLDTYLRIFRSIASETSPRWYQAANALFRAVTSDLLSTGEDNVEAVDFIELTTCLCLLASGSLRERLACIFSTFDIAERGTLESPSQTTLLLLSLLRLPLAGASSSGTRGDAQYAAAVALEDEEERDGIVSFETFYEWFVAFVEMGEEGWGQVDGGGDGSAVRARTAGRGLTSKDASQLTEAAFRHFNLHYFSFQELSDIFGEACGRQQAGISMEKFYKTFALVGRLADAETSSPNARAIVAALYDAFDADRSGYVDMRELRVGLSHLCAA